MSTLTFEDMIRAETERHVCRIWRKRDMELGSTAMMKYVALDTMKISSADLMTMTRVLIEFEGVSAVEIIDRRTGDGVCVYKDWP